MFSASVKVNRVRPSAKATSVSGLVQPLDGADSTMDYGDSFSINFINATTASKEGGLWTSVVASNEVSLFAQPVPEPSTWTLMGLGLLGVAAAAKRRRQAA